MVYTTHTMLQEKGRDLLSVSVKMAASCKTDEGATKIKSYMGQQIWADHLACRTREKD